MKKLFTLLSLFWGSMISQTYAQGAYVQNYFPTTNGVIRAMAEDQVNGLLYVVGNFTTVSGQPRNRAACIDLNSGALTSWNPNVTGQVFSVATNGTSVYLGGDISDVGGAPRSFLAEVDASTGLPTSWAPVLNNRVGAIALRGSNVYVGGRFTTVNGISKIRIAAIDATSGAPTAFQADANAEVRALLINGSRVIAGGNFTTINTLARPKLADLDLTTGAPSSWAPAPSAPGNIFSMALDGNVLYIGGNFTAVGGSPFTNIAAVNTVSGAALTSFNPGADNIVFGLGVAAGKVYAGGSFLNFGAAPKNRFAVCDAVDGTLDPLDFNFSNVVRAINVNSSRCIAAGSFFSVDGVARQRFAVITCNPNAPTAAATQTLCNGATIADLNATGSSIQWYDAASGGSVLASTTVLTNGTSYFASQSDGFCESVKRAAVAVNITSVASPGGSQTQNFCDAATVSDLIVSGSNIRWYDVASGGTQLNSTDALINGNTYFAAQFLTGCESASRLSVDVNIFSTSAPATTSPQAFCGSGTIADLSATGNNIQWYSSLSGGAPLSSLTALTDGQTYFATATDNNCESSARTAATVIISNPIPAPATISGTFTICGINTVTYTVQAVSGATSYTWTLPPGATGTSTSNIITINFDPSYVAGNISCAANNAGCQSNNKTFTVRRAPAQPASIVGQQNNLCGGNPYIYSIPNVAGATFYNWSVPAGATFTNPTPNSCAVTFPAGVSSGLISVQAANACGSSISRSINVTTAPATPNTIIGPVSVCANQAGLIYSVNPINGASNIQWSVPTGSTIISGQGTPSITVNWGSTGGNVRALAVNACATGLAVQQRVNISCREEVEFEENAEETIAESLIAKPSFEVFPNPGVDNLSIRVNDETVQAGKMIQITDMLGRQIWLGRLVMNNTDVNMSDAPSGVYFIRILGAEESPKRWIKQ